MTSDDDITKNYHGGNPQSRAANKRTRKNKDRARIVVYLHNRSLSFQPSPDFAETMRRLFLVGATAYECYTALGGKHQTYTARFSDLKKDNVIIGIGKTRPTDTGSPAEVCVLRSLWDAVQVAVKLQLTQHEPDSAQNESAEPELPLMAKPDDQEF
ncbi:MAG: hypothetical protein C5B54_09185 [Acidobacteria bacterium]|nr:MAG: hypothetical protein C5B54_09185 [Acidobacteriota bacterium]